MGKKVSKHKQVDDKSINDTIGWIKLASCPDRRFSEPFCVSPTEWAIAMETRYKSKQFEGLMKYDIIRDKWQEWIKYPKDTETDYHTATIDPELNIVYIFSYNQLIKTYLNTLDSHIIKLSTTNTFGTPYQSSLCICNKIYLFGTSAFKIWIDDQHKLFDFSASVFENQSNTAYTAICRKSAKAIYLFKTQWNYDRSCWFGGIWKLDLNKHMTSWEKLLLSSKVELVHGTKQIVAVMTVDEKYVLLIDCMQILVWNLTDMTIRTSNISVPTELSNGPYRGYIANDKKTHNLVICALARKYTMEHMCVSIDLVNLIAAYAWTEWLCLLAWQKKDNHWKIQVSTIINKLM